MFRWCISAAVLAASSAFAAAATILVPGSQISIQSAIDASSDGDTVLVAPGTYAGGVDFRGKLITLRSTAGAEKTIISANGTVGVTISGRAEIDGFTITRAAGTFGAGMVVNGVGSVVRHNIFDGNVQASGGFGAGIAGNGASPVVDGNVFRNHQADGQYLSGVLSFVNSSSPTIVNNLFVDNPTRAINLTLPEGNHPQVYNNTFVRNQTAIKYGSFLPATVFRNNILVDNTIGFDLDYPGYPPVFESNLVWHNGTDYYRMPDQTGINGNLSADPRFRNPLNDFRLSAGSPGVDRGTSAGAPDHDLVGNARPAGAGVDLGAYELPEPNTVAALSLAAALVWRRRPRPRPGSILPARI